MSKTKAEEPQYPEAEKWAKVHDKAVAILEFLEWKRHEETREGVRYGHWDDEDWVYDFFDINQNKLEAERQAMIDSLRS